MSVGISGFSDSSFTILYLPSIAMAFLWSAPNIQFGSLNWSILGQPFSVEYLAFVTFLSLIGSIQHHAVIKAIFGPSGPTVNPKKTSTARRGIATIILQVDPDSVPELQTNWEFAEFISSRELGFEILWNVVKFSPMMVTQLLATALIPVYAYLLFATRANGLIPILIFMALFTLKFRESFSAPIPSPLSKNDEVSQLEFEEKGDSRPQRAS